jgi:hypothetical protein
MKIESNFKWLKTKSWFFSFALVSLQLVSVSLCAQSQRFYKYQVGFEAALGLKNFTLSSNMDQLNKLHVIEEGATLGVFAGNKMVRAKIKQGFYTSSSAVANTTSEVRSSIGINFYPLQFIARNARLLPYLVTNVEHSVYRLHGYNGSDNSISSPVNYSVAEAPTLGIIAAWQATLGAGAEYRIKASGHFVNFFIETRYGKTFHSTTSTSVLNTTSTSSQVAVDIGIGFGFYR